MWNLEPDISIIIHTAVAFVLGWVVGYERVFRGRASGTQVYCLVSMASGALTTATGYGAHWFALGEASVPANTSQIIGSLLTGIGFLGAGIIVKSNTNIRGLTTAAAIWSTAAVGILTGLNLFGAAIGLTAMMIACMSIVSRIERRLPGQIAIVVTLRYHEGIRPREDQVEAFMGERGLAIQRDSLAVGFDGLRFDLQFLALAHSATREHSLARIAGDLPLLATVETFSVARANRA